VTVSASGSAISHPDQRSGPERVPGAAGGGTAGFWPALLLLWIVWAVRASVGFRFDLALDPAWRFAWSNGLKLALWALPAAAFGFWLRRESATRTLRLGPPALRSLPVALALIAVFLAGVAFDVARKRGVTLAELGAALAQRGGAHFAAGLPSAFAEEVLFRGLVLTELTERWGFWPANAVSGVIFVSMHWPHRIWRDGLSAGVFADAPTLLLIALALAVVVKRTGSIWPAVAFHAANNTLAGVL
jgi:membrane protease YdiL (CAAX protease family)